MNKIIIILVIFVMLFSGFTLLENSQTNNFYENNINTNNFISSNSPIYNLTIYIHNSPAGNGYYQQLFNFNNTSYFINNLNQNASNFYISYENGTLIYSWIQNWNFTTKNLSVWSKLQNGTTSVNFEVFPKIENLFSSTGYLGEFSEIKTGNDNYRKVFNWYYNNVSYTGQSIGNYNMTGFIAYFRSIISLGFIQLQNVSNNQNPMLYNYSGYGVFQIYNGGGDVNIYNFSIPTTQISGYYEYVYESNGSNIWYSGLNNKNHETSYSISLSKWRISGGGSSNFDLNYLIPLTNTLSMPTYNIELNTYNVNIKSFDKQSNPIHNYFFYNNSVYSANNNTFIFKNKTSFSAISLIPLNFSSYFTEYKNITISQSQFINNNNSYYYNLSIYYYNSNLNTVNPYDFANYIYPISILVFLLLGGIILFGTIKYRRSN